MRPHEVCGAGVRAAWIPPPRAWHQIWQDGTADLLPYGLLNPAGDYMWRQMWLSPVYLPPARICDLCPGLGYDSVTKIVIGMIRKGCAVREGISGGATNSIRKGRQTGGRDRERLYDYRAEQHRVEYRPIVPQTPTARHLRWLHSQPTPPPPPGLSRVRAELWAVLEEHAIGAAAHISARAIGDRLGTSTEMIHNHLRHLRLHHPGCVQRLIGCQTSVWRLRRLTRKRSVAEARLAAGGR